MLAARVAASFHDQEWLPAFVERVYHANFAEDHDIADRDTIADCLRAAGTDAERALAGALSDDGKARLRQNTSDAVSKGIFGAPSFVVGDELFWGNDRLEQALACARGWPASAQLGAPTRLPRATVGIEEESRSIGFDMASDRATGSLLRALAASKPDGHFLELGTGTGLATAWIADGMSATARLDTVDSDPELVAVARRHLAEDDRIHFRVGDASELIANLQRPTT